MRLCKDFAKSRYVNFASSPNFLKHAISVFDLYRSWRFFYLNKRSCFLQGFFHWAYMIVILNTLLFILTSSWKTMHIKLSQLELRLSNVFSSLWLPWDLLYSGNKNSDLHDTLSIEFLNQVKWNRITSPMDTQHELVLSSWLYRLSGRWMTAATSNSVI